MVVGLKMHSLRYVILRHDGVTEPHFDLLLETYPGSMLSTWRLQQWPIEQRAQATRLRDHRRLYLDYEGEIGGHRGFVHRVAAGQCEVAVGEANVWTIKLLTGISPQAFTLKPIEAEQWEMTSSQQ
jgi:hypothetical protein